jgi:hypothetical protein
VTDRRHRIPKRFLRLKILGDFVQVQQASARSCGCGPRLFFDAGGRSAFSAHSNEPLTQKARRRFPGAGSILATMKICR